MQHHFDERKNLVIEIDQDDREEITSQKDQGDRTDEDIFVDLIEPMLCNGWSTVAVALWSGFCITEDLVTDDHGDVIHCGDVFTYLDHAIRSEVDMLIEHGFVTLTRVESDETDKEFCFTVESFSFGPDVYGPYPTYEEAFTAMLEDQAKPKIDPTCEYHGPVLWPQD